MTREELNEVCERVSGFDANNESRVTISYQTYVADENFNPETAPIYNLTKSAIKLSRDIQNPDWYVLDIIFHSYQSPELKLLWGRLGMHRDNQNKYTDKDSIFYFNIVENDSIEKYGEESALLTIDVVNPLLFFLTRETPNGEGDNIIRMLVDSRLLAVKESINEFYAEEKANMLRELEEERYLNNAE